MADNATARRHARSHARNENNVQLCQPTVPRSHVCGVVGVRMFGDALSSFSQRSYHCVCSGCGSSGVPHSLQNLKFSGLGNPQCVHFSQQSLALLLQGAE